MADCGPFTCPEPRGRIIKPAGLTAAVAVGQATRWLIEWAKAFRRQIAGWEKKYPHKQTNQKKKKREAEGQRIARGRTNEGIKSAGFYRSSAAILRRTT